MARRIFRFGVSCFATFLWKTSPASLVSIALKRPVTVSGTCADTTLAFEGEPGDMDLSEKLPGAGEEIQATLVFLQQTLDCVIRTFSLPELFALGELLS